MSLFQTKLLGALKSKTMLFSCMLMIFGTVLDNAAYLQSFMTPHDYNIAFVGVSLVVATLRWITSQPLEEKHIQINDNSIVETTEITPVIPATPVETSVKPEPEKAAKPAAKPKKAKKAPEKSVPKAPKRVPKEPAIVSVKVASKQPVAKWKMKKVKDVQPK